MAYSPMCAWPSLQPLLYLLLTERTEDIRLALDSNLPYCAVRTSSFHLLSPAPTSLLGLRRTHQDLVPSPLCLKNISLFVVTFSFL